MKKSFSASRVGLLINALMAGAFADSPNTAIYNEPLRTQTARSVDRSHNQPQRKRDIDRACEALRGHYAAINREAHIARTNAQ